MVFELLGQGGDVSGTLSQLSGLQVYGRSVTQVGDGVAFLGSTGRDKRIAFLGDTPPEGLCLEAVQVTVGEAATSLWVGETSHANAQALRKAIPWTGPSCGGLSLSVGLGDRMGIATPGHVRAVRAGRMFPYLAQQSIREMERTHRTPDNVMDDATWGVFQEGWQGGFGADADHLKSPQDIDYCAAAGFLLYTLDPRDYVDNDANDEPIETLRAKYEALPWDALQSTAEETYSRYVGKTWCLDVSYTLAMGEEALLRAACKYGKAVSHLTGLYCHLTETMGSDPFELEISVDETETATRPEEHFYIASELSRLGVEWVSLAPRYVGRFEKGVDYIGDLDRFKAELAKHAAIARYLGPYKLSLHSGSDKFSIYPIAAEVAGDLVHLKTAGTSYLEALRAIARVEPDLFREIARFAVKHWDTERASYHVSAEMSLVPDIGSVTDANLPALLDDFSARQALHVSFGRVLTDRVDEGGYLFRDRIYQVLETDEEAHYAALESHIGRHIAPFGRPSA